MTLIKISEHQQLMESMRSLSSDLDAWSKDPGMLQGYYSILDAVENWKYSTGPIFDKPPFAAEMDGFEGGKLLKKSYLDIYEARLNNVYSSGFIGGNHIATVSPSSPITSPLIAAFFDTTASETKVKTINFYDNRSNTPNRYPALAGIGRIYQLSEFTHSYIVVGGRGAYSITLYYYDTENRVISASMLTAPFDFQSEYVMQYDKAGALEAITSGTIIWKRKRGR